MDKNLEIAHQLAIKDLGIISNSEQKITDLGKLKAWLAHEIQLLMDHDFHNFLNILYRIDIHEQKAKEAFADDTPSMRLAELIIERELQKVVSRKKHK